MHESGVGEKNYGTGQMSKIGIDKKTTRNVKIKSQRVELRIGSSEI